MLYKGQLNEFIRLEIDWRKWLLLKEKITDGLSVIWSYRQKIDVLSTCFQQIQFYF
jgi:hypothetical protein